MPLHIGYKTSLVSEQTAMDKLLLDPTMSPTLGTNLTYSDQTDDVGAEGWAILAEPDKVLAVVLIAIALAANIMSLAATCHTTGRRTSHFCLLVSLALSDTFVAFTMMLHLLNKITNPLYYPGRGPELQRRLSRCGYMILKALNTTGLNITLLNLMGMALDHYLAIVRPLHHSVLMSRFRTIVMICTLWAIALICGFSDFYSPLWELHDYYKWQHKFNYCEFIWLSAYQEEYIVFAVAVICFCSMTFMYVRIYFVARNPPLTGLLSSCHLPNPNNRPTTAAQQQRKTKLVLTTLLILGSFVLCWLPMCLFQVTLIAVVKVSPSLVEHILPFLMQADQYLLDLLLLNTICDPIIYAVRIKEVQLGYRRLFRRCRHQPRLVREESSHTALNMNGTYMTSLFRNSSVQREMTV